MDDNACEIIGDTDAWFAALVRGDFADQWDKDQQRIQAALARLGETNTSVCDASID